MTKFVVGFIFYAEEIYEHYNIPKEVQDIMHEKLCYNCVGNDAPTFLQNVDTCALAVNTRAKFRNDHNVPLDNEDFFSKEEDQEVERVLEEHNKVPKKDYSSLKDFYVDFVAFDGLENSEIAVGLELTSLEELNQKREELYDRLIKLLNDFPYSLDCVGIYTV